MSTQIKVKQSDFDNTEILDDAAINQIGQEVDELIELLDDDEDEDDGHTSTAVRYPGLTSNLKREYNDNGT